MIMMMITMIIVILIIITDNEDIRGDAKLSLRLVTR